MSAPKSVEKRATGFATALFVASSAVSAQGIILGTQPYGYYLSEELNVDLPTTTFGGGGNYSFFSPNSNKEIFAPEASLLPVSYANSVDAYDPISHALVTVSGSASVPLLDGSRQFLHAWALISGSTGDPRLGNSSEAVANIEWIDNTITVRSSTLPMGTAVTLQVTNLFDGAMTLGGAVIGDVNESSQLIQQNLQIGCHAQSVSNNFSSSFQVNLRQHYDVCTSVGANLALAVAYTSVINGGDGGYTAQADMVDTAGVYIDSLTPGATITSASGVNYATPSVHNVAEPPAVWLFGLGLLSLGAMRLTAAHTKRGRR